MIPPTNPIRRPQHRATSGFTLVEILVVIVIIGILMAIAIPAISNALRNAKTTAQRLEINALDQAVKAYEAKYSDYPPDGSSEAVMMRHMRKLFPRMGEPDLSLMPKLVDDSTTNTPGNFSPVAMDRAEALVFFLGGFSKNIQNPLTGPGGPIALIPGRTSGSTDIGDYQYNATRDNAFFSFDTERLTINRASDTSPLLSNDETLLKTVDKPHGGNDILPTYRAVAGDDAPIVYFDSRTYGVVGTANGGGNLYNGYYASSVGGVRPYKSDQAIKPPSGSTYGSEAAAFDAVNFQNPNAFQLISPGTDVFFGKLVSVDSSNPCISPTDTFQFPVHFTNAGVPVWPNSGATSTAGLVFIDPNPNPNPRVGNKGFQDSQWGGGDKINGNLDNVTNFTESSLGNGLE